MKDEKWSTELSMKWDCTRKHVCVSKYERERERLPSTAVCP